MKIHWRTGSTARAVGVVMWWLSSALGAAAAEGRSPIAPIAPIAPIGEQDLPSRGTPSGEVSGFHLERQPGWSIGLEGYSGLATLFTKGRSAGHAFAGGASSLRWRFFELGVGLEASDNGNERWQLLEGFVGAYLPFANWVDFDGAIGLGTRNYVSSDLRYGPAGASVRVPALTLRMGVSDRPLEQAISPRVGAALMMGIDLARRDVAYIYVAQFEEPTTGVTRFGGLSAGIAVTFGLDVAPQNRR